MQTQLADFIRDTPEGREADAQADIFAFGCVLYEMFTGRSPYHRETAVESMAAIVRDEPPALSAELRTLMPGLAPLLRRCVEKLANERFESARDLSFSLELVGQNLSSAALSDGSGEQEAVPESCTSGSRSVAAPSGRHASVPTATP